MKFPGMLLLLTLADGCDRVWRAGSVPSRLR